MFGVYQLGSNGHCVAGIICVMVGGHVCMWAAGPLRLSDHIHNTCLATQACMMYWWMINAHLSWTLSHHKTQLYTKRHLPGDAAYTISSLPSSLVARSPTLDLDSAWYANLWHGCMELRSGQLKWPQFEDGDELVFSGQSKWWMGGQCGRPQFGSGSSDQPTQLDLTSPQWKKEAPNTKLGHLMTRRNFTLSLHLIHSLYDKWLNLNELSRTVSGISPVVLIVSNMA